MTRQYAGVIGAHGSVEVTLTFEAGEVRGQWKPADGGSQGRLEGRFEGGRLELSVRDADGALAALLSCPAPRDGVLRGLWQSGDRKLLFAAEEVANDAPAGRAINGHYVRRGESSGGALDLLLVDEGRVKAQAYTSWGGGGGAGGAGAGEVAGYAVFDGRTARLDGPDGCVLTIEPIEGGLRVGQAGRCGAAFGGTYVRVSPVVPDWETFRWATE